MTGKVDHGIGRVGVSLTAKGGVTSIVGASNNQWQFQRVGGRWLMKERRAAYLGDDDYVGKLDAFSECYVADGCSEHGLVEAAIANRDEIGRMEPHYENASGTSRH